jgi:hypothetical protein
MPIAISVGGYHADPPNQLGSVRTSLCQFTRNCSDLVAITGSGGVNKRRNIRIQCN